MNKYVLIGAPHCGKTTLGRRVSELLQMPFFDTDVMAKEKMGEVRFIDAFSSYFNSRICEEQRKAIIELADLNGSAIIATGAEATLIPNCVEIMQSMGFIIHIKRKIETILDELKETVNSRSVLVNVDDGTILDFRKEAVEAYAEELSLYEAAADFTIDNNGSEDEGVEKLRTLIQVIIKTEQVQRAQAR